MNDHDSMRNCRILVIDDNRAIHEDFRKILSPPSADATALAEAEGKLFGEPVAASKSAVFEIDSAYQGEEGLQRLQEALQIGRPYAMAIVDVRMPPGWDGIETTQRLWAADPDLQVVICTAYSDYSWDDIIGKLGHSDGLLFLKKPFDTVEILQLANALTEKWCLIHQMRNQMDGLERVVGDRTKQLHTTKQKLRAEIAGHDESDKQLHRVLEGLWYTQQQAIQRERLRALGGMTSGIARDFQNALVGIRGLSELLLHRPENLDDKETAKRYLEMINTTAKDAGNVLNRLSEFCRKWDEQEASGTVDPNRLVAEAISATEATKAEDLGGG